MALPKLFQRIIWHNGTTPAINETNLNAMSKALDDIDDRLISLAGNVLEDVPQIKEILEDVETLSENPPYIGTNGHWYTWDTSTGAYVDSGVDASITVSVGSTTTLPAESSATVTNTGTSTDPVLNFGIPAGNTGAAGVSPEVTVTSITGGHTVTITDATHPSGQSFNVMDGTGDMSASTYDPSSTVAGAGGIPAYVTAMLPAITIDNTGTASSTGTRYQRIGVDAVFTAIDGTKYMEIANTSSTTYTFTHSDITASSAIDVYTDTWGDNPSAVVSTTGSCTVTFSAAQTRTVRIYIK